MQEIIEDLISMLSSEVHIKRITSFFSLREGVKKVFLGLCPKLWVGGGQESETFLVTKKCHVYMAYLTILSILFFHEFFITFWTPKP